jgi:DNA-binding XRE family transcriptional regulator
MPRLVAALRSEILSQTEPALGKLARALDGLRQLVEDLQDNVHQNGQALARLEEMPARSATPAPRIARPARDGRRARGRRPAPPAAAAPAAGAAAASSGFSPKAVQALRKGLALSRVRFAKLLGVSPGSIFGWEKGRTLPGRSSLARLVALGRGPARGPGRPPGSKAAAPAPVVRKPRRRRRARG